MKRKNEILCFVFLNRNNQAATQANSNMANSQAETDKA